MTSPGQRFEIIRAEGTTNLCTNPSVEKDTTGWASSGLATFERSTTWQARGAWSVHAVADGSGDKVQAPTMTPTAGQPYTCTARVHVVSGTWDASFGSGSQTGLTAGDWDVAITVTPGSGTAIRLELAATSTSGVAYIDGVQYEQKDHATSYCDGEQDGCVWNGAVHASTSTRPDGVRSGGAAVNITSDTTIGFNYSDVGGVGIPPLSHLTTDLGLADGARLQRVRAEPAVISLKALVRSDSLPDLHSLRRTLVDLVKPDAVSPLQPFRLRYSGSSTPVEIDAHYLAGLEAAMPSPSTREEITMQLIAYDPRWQERFDVGASLTPNTSVSNANRVIAQVSGVWTSFGTGANSDIWSVDIDAAGRVFVAGDFTSIGGVVASKAAYYDPADASWHAMGSGLTGGDGYTVKVAPDGRVYFGGAFTSAGGVSGTAHIAVWNPGSASWASLGSGTNGTVYSIVTDPTGALYAGGVFTTAGSASALGVARWDGSAWSDLAGVNLANGTVGVGVLAIAPHGDLYAGGSFYTAGGFDFEDLAKWDGSAWSEVASSFDSTVESLLFGSDGYLYVSGEFQTPFAHIARWNGSSLSGLGSGLNGTTGISTLAQLPNGEVLVGGWFTSAGGLDLADRVARWTGSAWKPLLIDLPGSAATGVYVRSNGDIYLHGLFAGTAVAPGVTTVTNPGSSQAYPIIRVNGPGTLRGIVNITTGQEILFDGFSVASGETITIDLRPGKKSITSTARGSVLSFVLGGSDLATWALLPGTNQIALLVEPSASITSRTSTTAASSSGSTISLTKPSTLANGDVLIANISTKGGTGLTITPPTGFTLTQRANVGAAGTDLVVAAYQKVVTSAGTEPSSYSFTLSSPQPYEARLNTFIGVDNVTPTASPVNTTNTGTTLAMPSATSTVAGSIFRAVVGGAVGNQDITTPASLAQHSQAGTSTTTRLEIATETLLGIGNTGVQNFSTASSEQLAGVGFILNASASATQPTADIYFRPRHWGSE